MLNGTVTDAGSSVKNRTGNWRSKKPVVDASKCIGCGQCAAFCPEPCIGIKDKKSVIDYDYCKGCGICASVCPLKCISMIDDK